MQESQSVSSRTGTNQAAEDVIASCPCYLSETINDRIKMINQYPRTDWANLKMEWNNRLRHSDSKGYVYTRLYLERQCQDQLDCENISLEAFILAYDNISCIIINRRALAKYSQVEMMLGGLPRDWTAKVVMKLELDPRDHSTSKYDKVQNHVLYQCGSTDSVALLDSEVLYGVRCPESLY